MAITATLQTAPPLFPALKTQLKRTENPFFLVDVSLVDDAKMHALNRDYRGKNKPTDVLSFAQFETQDDVLDDVGLAGDFAFGFSGDSEELSLGDLVISIDTAARQAGELKHSLEREIAFLSIHGTLHLLGYDHIQSGPRRQMWKWQESLFEELWPV